MVAHLLINDYYLYHYMFPFANLWLYKMINIFPSESTAMKAGIFLKIEQLFFFIKLTPTSSLLIKYSWDILISGYITLAIFSFITFI
jgi:hypothetical protein